MAAMAKRGKLVALSITVVGVLVLAVAGFAAKDRILEEWYLRRLSGTDDEAAAAVERLGAIGSVCARRSLAL